MVKESRRALRPLPFTQRSKAHSMWCAECQLDVPTLAVPEEPGVIRCAFCRGELAERQKPAALKEVKTGTESQAAEGPESDKRQQTRDRGQQTGTSGHNSEVSRNATTIEAVPRLLLLPPPAVDDWQGEADLRHAERLLAVLRQSSDCSPAQTSADAAMRFDEIVAPSHPPSEVHNLQAWSSGLAAWACLTLGLMAFVCGGVLLAWSFLADRGDLWSLGLPLTLAGQVGLVLGLLLQLDGLSQSSRRTEQTLTELDGQLDELRGVTALVSSTHSAPAHSFYAHMSAGASPQILLADLKGQLDLLAQQMARQKAA